MATPEDPLVAAVIAAALDTDDEGHDRWADVRTLQERGGDAVFDAARRLLVSGDWRERQLGVDILAQSISCHLVRFLAWFGLGHMKGDLCGKIFLPVQARPWV